MVDLSCSDLHDVNWYEADEHYLDIDLKFWSFCVAVELSNFISMFVGIIIDEI